jgi:transcriptional regulator with XRE-family HTH domain
MPHTVQVENLPRINSVVEIDLREVLSYLITLTGQETAHTMNIGQELKRARERRGLTVRALSELGGTSPAAISQIEHGARGVSVERIESLLQKTRSRLLVIPTIVNTPVEVSDIIRGYLQDGQRDRAYRGLIGYSDALKSLDPGIRVAITCSGPASTSDPLFDAALASLVEHWLRIDNLPLPKWLEEPEFSLTLPMHLFEASSELPPAESDVPISFLRHGVLFPAEALESI